MGLGGAAPLMSQNSSVGAKPDPIEPLRMWGWQQGQGTQPCRAHLSRSSRTGTRWPAGGFSPGSPAGLGRKRSPPPCSAVETAQRGGAATHHGKAPHVPGLLPPSHLVQVNCHLVGLHLHLLHQVLPLQLQGHSSGRATAAPWVPSTPSRCSSCVPQPLRAGTCGTGYPRGGQGPPHLHHGFLVGAVARWQLGLDDNHVGGRTLPAVPARAEPRRGFRDSLPPWLLLSSPNPG